MKNNYYKPIVGVLLTLILWQIIASLGIFNPIYFASPIEVIKEFGIMVTSGGIFSDMGSSLWRILISISFAALVGVPLGIVFGYLSNFYKFFGEIIDFFRSIPPIVFYPLFLIALGVGNGSRIAVGVIGATVVIILIVSKGLFQRTASHREYLVSLGASQWQVVKNVVWYEALPHIFTALRTATSLAIVIIVVTEMLVGSRFGLGTRVQNVQITSNIPDLFATIIVIGLVGIILNKFLVFLEKKYVFWRSG